MPEENKEGEKTPEEKAEETAAEVADQLKNKETESESQDEKSSVKVPVVDQAAIIQETAKAVAEALKPGMTPEQQEAQLKALEESSGFSRKQLVFLGQEFKKTAVSTNLGISKELGKAKAEKALGAYSEALIKKVEEAMAGQPPEVQANPEAWEKLAFMVKGQWSDSVKPSGRKVVTNDGGEGGMKPPLSGKAGSGVPKGGGSGRQYDADEQTIIRQYFNGKPEDYEKYKGQKTVTLTPEGGQGSNTADKEFQRLTSGNTSF